jgi:uncharacterized protein
MSSNDSLIEAVTAFAEAAREAGVATGPTHVAGAVAALARLRPRSWDDLYWATRLTFCSREADIVVFDRVFAAWFGSRASVSENVTSLDSARVRAAAAADGEGTSPSDRALSAASMGLNERLSRRDGRVLSAADAAEIEEYVTLLRAGTHLRRSRRSVAGGRRQIDPRRSALLALRGGGELARICYQKPSRRPRRLVLLLDVSGSMARAGHLDAFLRLARALVIVAPRTTEVFTLGTKLTRITLELRHHDHAHAMRSVAAVILDREGGTLLAAVLERFLDEWAGRRAARSTLTVVVSDGWIADWSKLAEPMERLSRLAHRVIWVNPDAGSEDFKEMAPGLRASRPYVARRIGGRGRETARTLANEIALA